MLLYTNIKIEYVFNKLHSVYLVSHYEGVLYLYEVKKKKRSLEASTQQQIGKTDE